MDSTAGREQAAPARAGAGPGQDAGTALSGPWLGLARLTWVALVALTLTLAAGGFAVAFRHPETAALDVTREAVAQVGLSSDVLLLALFRLGPMVVFTAASLIIFRRRSDDPVALVVALALVTLGATGSRSLYALYQAQPPLRPAVLLVWHVGVFSCVLLLALFPSGRFVPRWTRLLTLAAVPALALFPELPEALQTLPTRPDGLAPWRWRAMTLLVVGLYAAGVAAQVHRYRRVSGPTERLQTKWVMSAIGAWLAVGVFAPGAVSLVEGRTVWLGWLQLAAAVTGCLIPIAIGVAILRHHLWRIDLILDRTLVYVPLTAILGGLYAASITLFQRLFVALTGSQSDAAIVMTTLVLARGLHAGEECLAGRRRCPVQAAARRDQEPTGARGGGAGGVRGGRSPQAGLPPPDRGRGRAPGRQRGGLPGAGRTPRPGVQPRGVAGGRGRDQGAVGRRRGPGRPAVPGSPLRKPRLHGAGP